MISFQPSTHTYTVNDKPFISVTTLLSTWFPKFDADKTIAKMNPPNPIELKAEWEEKGRIAAELGTQLHESIEAYFKGTPIPLDTVEYGYFQDFVAMSTLNTFQVEWRIFHEPTSLIGTIDYVSKNEDGSIDLYDWKRSSDLSKGYGRCLLPELSHIPDTKYWKYTLQLNLYRFLAKENGYKVNKMYIVCFHPSNSGFQKLEVQVIDVKTILNKYRGTTTCG